MATMESTNRHIRLLLMCFIDLAIVTMMMMMMKLPILPCAEKN